MPLLALSFVGIKGSIGVIGHPTVKEDTFSIRRVYLEAGAYVRRHGSGRGRYTSDETTGSHCIDVIEKLLVKFCCFAKAAPDDTQKNRVSTVRLQLGYEELGRRRWRRIELLRVQNWQQSIGEPVCSSFATTIIVPLTSGQLFSSQTVRVNVSPKSASRRRDNTEVGLVCSEAVCRPSPYSRLPGSRCSRARVADCSPVHHRDSGRTCGPTYRFFWRGAHINAR